MKETCDVIVIGGGFFGMYVAEYLALQGRNVILLEQERDFMQRASYVNQARVHNGYHYPRSILTALRSRISFPRFAQEFSSCIDDSFEKYYMIGRQLSNVTARQFELFCKRIGVPCERSTGAVSSLVNPALIEAVFSTVEYAFDAVRLKEEMAGRLERAGVDCRMGHRVSRVYRDGECPGVEAVVTETGETLVFDSRQVFNCTYSMINKVLSASGIDTLPLKHEITEICLVDVPDLLKDKGLTVMCGPFFSVMPFPARGLHSFTHVRYTPHCEWQDQAKQRYRDGYRYLVSAPWASSWKHMLHDARRYIPLLEGCIYRESMWEVKTVLPRSESNDARPILFRPNYGIRGLHSLMGGKIDNVYDVVSRIETLEEAGA